MDKMDGLDKETIAAMAEAILLLPDRLPIGIENDLATLHQMVEKAVQGKTDAFFLPPAYGKISVLERDAEDKNTLCLRTDTVVLEKERLIELSARREGDYITVPRVVQNQSEVQGGNHA